MSNPYVDPANDGGLPVAGEIIEPQQADDEIIDIEDEEAAGIAETQRAEGAEAGVSGTISSVSHAVTVETARATAAEGLLLPITALPTAVVTALLAGTNITLTGGDGQGHGAITISSHQTVLNGVTVTGTPIAGQTLVADSPTAASWQTVSYSSTSPVFTAIAPPGTGTIGVAYSYQFTATNTPTSWAVASGTIPTGLTFSTSTGLLSGTPTTGATYTFAVSVTNGSGTATSGGLMITVTAPAPVFTAVTPTTPAPIGTAYTYTFAASNTTSFVVYSGTLPTGLTLASGGVLSGTPSTAATSTFTVRATGPGGTSTSGTLTIVSTSTAPAAPVFTSYAPPAATSGAAYSYQFAASNTPTSWAVASGSVPTGLTFSTSTGLLSGTPTTAGTYTFTLSATNAGGTGTTGTLNIITTAAPVFTAKTPPAATTGQTYSYQFAASGSPTSWAVASGTIPAGLTFSTSTGLLSGTPTTAATYTFVINAINGAGATGSGTLSVITSVPAPAFTADSPPAGTISVAYSYQFTATNTTSFTLGAGSIPAGLTLSSGGLLSGTPTTATSYPFSVVATGPTSPAATASVTVVINYPSYSSTVLADAPVGYWRCNETSGTVAADSSGYSHPGTYTGTYTLGATSPITSDTTARALSLTGTGGAGPGGYITIPDTATLSPTGSALTLECWIRGATSGVAAESYAGYFWKGSTAESTNAYGLQVDSSGVYPVVAVQTPVGLAQSVSGTTTDTAVWFYVVGVYNGSTLTVYVNGVANTPVTVTGNIVSTTGSPLQIGAIQSPASPYAYQWNGYVCEAAIYTTALSSARITAHYNAATA
jgi:hypothetical protein